MDFESIRPVLSGVIGGAVAIWLSVKWARFVPNADKPIAAASLTRTYRGAIIAANVLFFSGLVVGIALYSLAGYENTDWVPLGLGFGGGSFASIVTLAGFAILTGRSVRDALTAYAISQQGPIVVIYGILALGVLAFVAAVASLLT